MTDELIILNSCGDYTGEGFFKFEDGFTKMTVAFKDISQKPSMWYADGSFGLFGQKTIARADIKFKPENCGIFVLQGENAYIILYCGDKDEVCRGFTAATGRKVEDKIEEKVEEVKVVNAESSASADIPADTAEAVSGIEAKEVPQPDTVTVFAQPAKIPETFWDVNEKDFNRLFESSPEDAYMNSLIPGSKWVRRDEENYVLGIIYDEYSQPLYLCYGFMLPWSEEPPEKLEGYSQWIPKDCAHPHDDGYWVVYINAKTGERVR